MAATHEDLDFNPNDYVPTIVQEKKKNKRKYYKSSTGHKAKIVNAETGQVTNHLVGSEDELRYYTVMINEGKEGVKLFYNTPEQCESHRNSVIDDSVKIEWHNREHQRRIREFNSNQTEEPSHTDGKIIIK